jgi:membrane protein implicated in regulation of membrane protease activity
MPERSFFELRYALPGYTFVLMAFLILAPDLLTLFMHIPTDLVGLIAPFLAFFTLLEGSAVGFLMSQIWWLIFNRWLRKGRLQEAREFLREKSRFSKEGKEYELIQGDLKKETAFLDYIFFKTENREMLSYIQRRWDLLHTLGSTLVALSLGSLLGIVFRLGWHGFDLGLWFQFQCWKWDIVAIVIFIFLFLLLRSSFRFANDEHEKMTSLVIRKAWKSYGKDFDVEKAEKDFPQGYFKEKKKNG